MAILTSILSSFALGLFVVGYTSPTTHVLYHEHEVSFLNVHGAIVDLVIASMIALTLLCRIEPKFIAEHHSFPYTSQIEWTVQREGFDFQLLVFEIFHQWKSSRVTHIFNIICEGFFWLLVVRLTFGITGIAVLMILLAGQAMSYGDILLAIAIIVVQMLYATMCEASLVLSPWNTITQLNGAKVAIVWLAMARTINHAFDPLPPTYYPQVEQFDAGFGAPAWNVCLSNPLKSMGLMVLGLASETEAGSPGRFLNQIIYKLLWKVGYRSAVLLDVMEAKALSRSVVQRGWHAAPMTAAVYDWATAAAPQLLPVADEKLYIVEVEG